MNGKPNWPLFLLIAGVAYLIFRKPTPAAASPTVTPIQPAPTPLITLPTTVVTAPSNLSASTQTMYSNIVNSTPAAQAVTTSQQADPWVNNPLMQFEIQ